MRKNSVENIEVIVIGASAGGLKALQNICNNLKPDFKKPVIIVQHIHAHADGFMVWHLNSLCPLRVKEAEDKEVLEKGVIYIAPANYHVMINDDHTISLTTDAHVNYSRPSIDVLFESASYVYGNHLAGIILTGANNDGAAGMRSVKKAGGITIIQDPETAEVSIMPESVLGMIKVDYILSLEEIAVFLNNLN